MGQSGKLSLNGVTFALDDCKNTRLYIFESDQHKGTITIGFDVWFQNGTYWGENVSPSICINSHETGKANITELLGCTYHVDTIEEIDNREDLFYVFEHEPMEKYSFTITEIIHQRIHIQIEGIAIVDGYADPYIASPFSGDFWLHY